MMRQNTKNKAIMCWGGACFTVTRKDFAAASPPTPLSSTDSAHSLLRLSHLLGEVVCSCSPVPNLCPQSGARPFSLGCLHCSPLLKSFVSTYQVYLLSFVPWSLLLFLAFSVLIKFRFFCFFDCPCLPRCPLLKGSMCCISHTCLKYRVHCFFTAKQFSSLIHGQIASLWNDSF